MGLEHPFGFLQETLCLLPELRSRDAAIRGEPMLCHETPWFHSTLLPVSRPAEGCKGPPPHGRSSLDVRSVCCVLSRRDGLALKVGLGGRSRGAALLTSEDRSTKTSHTIHARPT